MADISKIVLLNGTTYDVKDAEAREQIEEISSAISGGVTFEGATSTELTNGSTVKNIVINGETVEAKKGWLVAYNQKEFVFDGTQWIEMGDLSSLGSLAYKNSATGSFTPQGSVSAPTVSVSSAGSTATVVSMTDEGSLPSLTMSVVNETLTFSFDEGVLPTGSNVTVKTGDASYSASVPTFTGTADTVTVS